MSNKTINLPLPKLEDSVYIPSIEASHIYSSMFRDRENELQYIGMIPSSLELNKLISTGMKVKQASKKRISDDVFNLKFKYNVKSAEDIIKDNNKNIAKLTDEQEEYKHKLIEFNSVLDSKIGVKNWCEVSSEELRKQLYTNGFTYNGHKYVAYKRSSAKSRTGQCLFIKENLYDEMISWSRMGLSFGEDKIDFASLLAYESLVGSSLESLVKINPKNILIVDDKYSSFPNDANVIRKNEKGYLDSYQEKTMINNNLFDGQSLLSSEYFPEGKAMILLRNHMFKSAAFNCNIQEYLIDNCPVDVSYDEWQIPDMFGNTLLAKDVHMITTPSSLKALKYANIVGGEKEMWNYWKGIVEVEGSIFGVCKSEKASKHEDRQQTSYQMINSLPASFEDIKELATYERDEYIMSLKNDDDFFIKYVRESANSINSNMMFVELYKHNKEIVRTKQFRDFRKKEINNHVTHIKSGKVRLLGDYAVMIGNGMEYLAHAIGKEIKPTLIGNQIYTTLHEFGKQLVGFRNPHTSPSNVIIFENIYNADIKKYFNLTSNIVCVNAIDFPLQDKLSGCDYDSDNVLLFDSAKTLELARKCQEYRVCVNAVESDPNKYQVTMKNMATIDNQLSTSQRNIGEVTNQGQLCLSSYWDLLDNGSTRDELAELLKKVDVMTVLSGICIDLSKKLYDVDIKKEIVNVKKMKELRKDKPNFWKYVSESDKIKTMKYNCPMDYLNECMSGLPDANEKVPLALSSLIKNGNVKKGDRKQIKKIIKYAQNMRDKTSSVRKNESLDDKEVYRAIESIEDFYTTRISRLTLNPDTMYALLMQIAKMKTDTKVTRKSLNFMYQTQKETFVNAFKN